MKFHFLVFLLFMSIAPVFADEFEYGKPAKLKGLKKVYINSGSDKESSEIFESR